MLKKTALIAAAAASTFVALPAAAQAQYRGGYYDYGRYERGYDYGRYDRYGRPDRYGQYDRYGRRIDDRRYSQSRYGDGYYRGQTYRDGSRRECSGTTGTIVGGAAGALLGREVDRSGDRRYGRRTDSTVGTIIGGAIGALAGRAMDKADC